MTAEQIYQTVLEELASEGNEKAKFALNVGKKFNETPRSRVYSNVCDELSSCSKSISEAISWNRAEDVDETEKELMNAQERLMQAMVSMASR